MDHPLCMTDPQKVTIPRLAQKVGVERREGKESRTDWMVVKRSFARTALAHRICTGISQRRLDFLSAELASRWMAQQGSQLRERRGHERLRAEDGGPAQSRCHHRRERPYFRHALVRHFGEQYAVSVRLCTETDTPHAGHRPCAALILDEPQPRTDSPLAVPCGPDASETPHPCSPAARGVSSSQQIPNLHHVHVCTLSDAGNRLPGSVRADHHRGQLPACQVNRGLRLTQCHSRRLQVVLLACHSGHRASGHAGPIRWACSSKRQGVAAWQARRW